MKKNGINYRCSICRSEQFFSFMWNLKPTEENERIGMFAECTGRNAHGTKCIKIIKVLVRQEEYAVLRVARRHYGRHPND